MAEDKTETSGNAEGDNKTQSQEASPTAKDKKEDVAVEEKAKENGEQGDAKPKENGDKASPEPPKDMRAIVLHGYGGITRVKATKKSEPTLADGEVLIKVKTCGLSFQDLMARQGALDGTPKPPCILGFECAGDVEQVGAGVENFKVGDKVVALPDHKAFAEYVAVPATSVFQIPQGMSYQDAVAVTMNYTVAYILLFELANIVPGKSILLHSAAGGVGQAIAQLAKTVKDVTIFGVCNKSKHDALKEIGTIDHIIDRASDYSAAVKKESPEGVDIVFDCMYGEECRRGYALLKPLGRYILYGLSNAAETKSLLSAAKFWWQVNKIPPIKLFEENKSMTGFNLRHLMYQKGNNAFIQKCVNQVFTLWNEGKIKPLVDSVYALEDVTEAMQKMHEHKNVGKIVLDLSLEPKPKPVTPAKNKNKDKKNALQDDKKASSMDSDDGEKKKEPEMTNGSAEDKSENGTTDSKEKESS